MSLINWVVLLLALSVMNISLSIIQIRGFLSRTAAIRNAEDLANFKRLARRQMRQVVLQAVFLFGAIGLSLYGMVTDRCSLLHVLGLSLAILATGLIIKPFESRIRSLPVEDESLAEEYAAVCHSWVKRLLPDF